MLFDGGYVPIEPFTMNLSALKSHAAPQNKSGGGENAEQACVNHRLTDSYYETSNF